jgi:aryl-alcohol dehydrogenase-like predicted oxidoreductase
MFSESDSIIRFWESQSSRLVLGTAQLGMRYGIANKSGQPNKLKAESIIAKVWEYGVREFDTAQAYGESELALGHALGSLGLTGEAKVISKFHPCIDYRSTISLRRALEKTLTQLGQDKLYGMMLHGEHFLKYWDTGLGAVLLEFVEKELVEHLGISVYTPQSAIGALKTEGISLVQVPSNLLDRRFEDAGVFHEAQSCGKQIYVRSIFLQGLLLMNGGDLSESMRFAIPVIEKLGNVSRKTGFSLKQLALGYVKSAYSETKVIFGCETAQQATENLELWKTELPPQIVENLRMEFRDVPEKVLNPSLWV